MGVSPFLFAPRDCSCEVGGIQLCVLPGAPGPVVAPAWTCSGRGGRFNISAGDVTPEALIPLTGGCAVSAPLPTLAGPRRLPCPWRGDFPQPEGRKPPSISWPSVNEPPTFLKLCIHPEACSHLNCPSLISGTPAGLPDGRTSCPAHCSWLPRSGTCYQAAETG